MKKKLWIKPELLAIVHGNTGETVLASCQYASGDTRVPVCEFFETTYSLLEQTYNS